MALLLFPFRLDRCRYFFSRSHRGQALIELALAAPVLISLLIAILETGAFISSVSVVDRAARETAFAVRDSRSFDDARARAESRARAVLGETRVEFLELDLSSSGENARGGYVAVELKGRHHGVYLPYSYDIPARAAGSIHLWRNVE